MRETYVLQDFRVELNLTLTPLSCIDRQTIDKAQELWLTLNMSEGQSGYFKSTATDNKEESKTGSQSLRNEADEIKGKDREKVLEKGAERQTSVQPKNAESAAEDDLEQETQGEFKSLKQTLQEVKEKIDNLPEEVQTSKKMLEKLDDITKKYETFKAKVISGAGWGTVAALSAESAAFFGGGAAAIFGNAEFGLNVITTTSKVAGGFEGAVLGVSAAALLSSKLMYKFREQKIYSDVWKAEKMAQ
jgi:hypothetical protein